MVVITSRGDYFFALNINPGSDRWQALLMQSESLEVRAFFPAPAFSLLTSLVHYGK